MAGNNDVHRGPGKDKRIRAAFVRFYDANPEELDKLVPVAHKQAISGDMQAFSFIRDTMDGRPAQAIEPPETGSGKLVIEWSNE